MSPHRDPAHVRCDFFTPASVGPVQVEIKVLSASKRWTRLDFELLQYPTPGDRSSGDRKLILSGHAMFTILPELGPPAPPTGDNLTVLPHTPCSQSRICPIRRHPAELEGQKLDYAFNFKDGVRWAQDVNVEGQVDSDGRQKMEWGAWWQQMREEDRVDTSAAFLPFFADQFKNGPELLRDGHKIEGKFWFPTLTFALDFKSRWPLAAIPGVEGSTPASHTVGLYSVTKFCSDGRHDISVEVWSAPCNLGEKSIKWVGMASAGSSFLLTSSFYSLRLCILFLFSELEVTSGEARLRFSASVHKWLLSCHSLSINAMTRAHRRSMESCSHELRYVIHYTNVTYTNHVE